MFFVIYLIFAIIWSIGIIAKNKYRHFTVAFIYTFFLRHCYPTPHIIFNMNTKSGQKIR
jgi:hypothetical protein